MISVVLNRNTGNLRDIFIMHILFINLLNLKRTPFTNVSDLKFDIKRLADMAE